VQTVHDQAGAGIDQAEPLTDDTLHSPLEEHALHDAAGRSVGIVEGRRVLRSTSVEQLVPEDSTFGVDDRLSCEEHL